VNESVGRSPSFDGNALTSVIVPPPRGGEGHEPRKGGFRFLHRSRGNLELRFLHRRHRQPRHHHIYELFAAIVVNLIATVLKFGDRTQIGAVHLSTSLVADLQLVAAACVWAIAVHVTGEGMSRMSPPAWFR
jgi:hypothetical protein